jgi:cation diffusion facilitator CzcD-associated flavoprotein CzcO
MAASTTDFDILVVGGGISGVNSAYRISTLLPSSSFAVLESRHELGGTWSQFKYPGVRSDSDLHTFGFPFNPWKSSNTIASGESIISYMNETVEKFDLNKYIRCGHRVISADWRPEEQRWRLDVDISSDDVGEPRRVVYWTKWLILGTGYYSYEKPMKARIEGLENFQGPVAHPQFWPKDLDYKDKKVVVIGSGATAISLLPAMVDGGAKHVTQLQRSPTYIMSMSQEKPEDQTWLQSRLPSWLMSRWTRKCLLPHT